MRVLAALALVALAVGWLALPLSLAQSPMAAPFELSYHQWEHRLILVFAPSEKSPVFEKQDQLFAEATDELEERDVLLVRVFAEGQSQAGDLRFDEAKAAALRSQFGLTADDFAVVLVGKDGTEKRRDRAPVLPEALFEAIDAMPMRQREMKKG